jgi:hypothetical protein
VIGVVAQVPVCAVRALHGAQVHRHDLRRREMADVFHERALPQAVAIREERHHAGGVGLPWNGAAGEISNPGGECETAGVGAPEHRQHPKPIIDQLETAGAAVQQRDVKRALQPIENCVRLVGPQCKQRLSVQAVPAAGVMGVSMQRQGQRSGGSNRRGELSCRRGGCCSSRGKPERHLRLRQDPGARILSPGLRQVLGSDQSAQSRHASTPRADSRSRRLLHHLVPVTSETKFPFPGVKPSYACGGV